MSANIIPTFQVEQFSTNVQLLVQQKGSKLRDKVMVGAHFGKQASPVDQVGTITANKVTSRFAPMSRIDAPTDRRWVFPNDYDVPQLIDTFDKLRLIVDPTSAEVQSAVYALGRAQDDEIINALGGTAKTGEQGGTSTAFLAANVIGVNTGGTTSSMNVAKLRAVRKLFRSYEVDIDADPIFMALTSKEEDSLLNEIQIVSTDYNSTPVLVDGKLQSFLGFNFVQIERLVTGTDDQSGTSNACYAWAKSGMHLGIWGEIESSVDQRVDLQGKPWQIYSKGTFGATRIEEKKVIKVWCR